MCHETKLALSTLAQLAGLVLDDMERRSLGLVDSSSLAVRSAALSSG